MIVNTHRVNTWTMPAQIHTNCEILSKINVKDTKGLKNYIQTNKGIPEFDDESIKIFNQLFKISS